MRVQSLLCISATTDLLLGGVLKVALGPHKEGAHKPVPRACCFSPPSTTAAVVHDAIHNEYVLLQKVVAQSAERKYSDDATHEADKGYGQADVDNLAHDEQHRCLAGARLLVHLEHHHGGHDENQQNAKTHAQHIQPMMLVRLQCNDHHNEDEFPSAGRAHGTPFILANEHSDQCHTKLVEQSDQLPRVREDAALVTDKE
mmetsp:Transcript_5923/g.16335  ORF Transcript_5923/g.16335 Transcript_5923/m.16335 type:complete len:200 (+) Transcript_5923:3426-4025(+)